MREEGGRGASAGGPGPSPDRGRSPERGPSPERGREIEEVAASYLVAADGDPKAALAAAVADGLSAAALVSRGFARWGQPARPRR